MENSADKKKITDGLNAISYISLDGKKLDEFFSLTDKAHAFVQTHGSKENNDKMKRTWDNINSMKNNQVREEDFDSVKKIMLDMVSLISPR